MNVTLKIAVALMPTALILLEVITAPAMLDILEMATHVMVCLIGTTCIEIYFGGIPPLYTYICRDVYSSCTIIRVHVCTYAQIYRYR